LEEEASHHEKKLKIKEEGFFFGNCKLYTIPFQNNNVVFFFNGTTHGSLVFGGI